MKKASKLLSAAEAQRIEDAVHAAESRTSAEIVPLLASDSGRYDRAEDIVGLWGGLMLMAIAWALLQGQSAEEAQWGTSWSRFELPILIGAVIAGFFLGAHAAAYVPWLRRVFTPRKEMSEEVTRGAGRAFYNRRVHHTDGGTGLLIYISLHERMVALLGDQAVLDALGKTELQKICNDLTVGIRAGDIATSLCQAIERSGEKLAEQLPRQEGDKNELANALVFKD